MGMSDILELTSKSTLAQMLERDDFANRFAANEPISMMEFMYPLLQAFDSVAVEADIEMGGTDQLFNLMMGRQVQERYGHRPQMVLTMPLLVGTDGEKKMSQSLSNYIGINDAPGEMFAKTMSIPDPAMPQWFTLASGLAWDDIVRTISELSADAVHPGEAKRSLARSIVDLYHGEGTGQAAEEAFDRQFKANEVPEGIPIHSLGPDDPIHVPSLLREAGLVASGSEGRRMLSQGAVKLNGEKVTEETVSRGSLVDAVVQVGKRRFARLV